MNYRHLVPAGKGGYRDTEDRKVVDWFKTSKDVGTVDVGTVDVGTVDVGLLGVPLSKTSISHSAAFMFPASVRQTFGAFSTYSVESDIDLSEMLGAADFGDVAMHPTDLQRCLHQVEEAFFDYWTSPGAKLTLVLGGDHGITAPILAARAAVDSRFAVLHFDAHHDLRNLEDGGPTNGTPFRRLLSGGHLQGARLAQVGLRDFVNVRAYTQYARDHGVHLVPMGEVRRNGLQTVVERALDAIAPEPDWPIYVSFDLDVLDPAIAPGVPAPSPGGLGLFEVYDVLQFLGADHRVFALDLVCADPLVDVRQTTSRLATTLLLHFCLGRAKGKGSQ